MSDENSPINVGVSWLRTLCASNLKTLDRIAIIHNHAEPISVLIPYEVYLVAQDCLRQFEKAVTR